MVVFWLVSVCVDPRVSLGARGSNARCHPTVSAHSFATFC